MMNEDPFEKTHKAFFGIKEVPSVPSDAERDLEKVMKLAGEILQRIEIRDKTLTQ